MKLRALVFEDDESICFMIASILEKRGYEVFKFSEVGGCPLFLKQDCPCPLNYVCADIIITDINMSGINGLNFIENQLNHGCKAENIGVMSGTWDDNQIKQANKLNTHIFHKPFELENLFSWLEACESKIDPERKLSDWFINNK
ncbi:response regulator [bacterium]|nr:response regulator [bacterium]